MSSWEVALGCAGKRKKVDRADIPSSRPRGLSPEDVTTCHLFSGCEIPFPLEEAAASAAPTREGSFGRLHSLVPEAPLFSATPRQTDLPVCEVVAEPAPRTATCYACCAPITGTVYMGFDRAFCSATACHKGLAVGSILPIRVRILWLLGIGVTPRYSRLAIPRRILCHTQVNLTECRPSRPCDRERDREHKSQRRRAATLCSTFH